MDEAELLKTVYVVSEAGGRSAERWERGAPNKPGIRNIANENDAIAKTTLPAPTSVTGESWEVLIFPRRYRPRQTVIAIQTAITSGLEIIPHPNHTSTAEMYFILNARRMNAKITLTILSHPPDFGIFFIKEGKNENITNGNENAEPNTSIPRTGFMATPPETAAARIDPTKGPVHENETITIASATKKEAIRPPLSAFESALLASPPGRVISKAPRNDIAKTMKRTPKIAFGIQCEPSVSVASVLLNRATKIPTSV